MKAFHIHSRCLTSVGALDQIGFLEWRLRDEGWWRNGGASRGAGALSRRFLHPLHGHKHARKLLQRHVAELRGERAGWILQTHQPARVTCEDGSKKRFTLLQIHFCLVGFFRRF